jgi:LPXTG-site transpeptidase (sortase) family protein
LLLVAAVGVAYPLWWQHHSETAGKRLLEQGFGTTQPRNGRVRARPGTAACVRALPPSHTGGQVLSGVLEIPALELTAPVLQGLNDGVLNVAVGHDPPSPWPGAAGESVLEAHDVSWFSRIDSLRPGEQVVWRDSCQRSVYKVLSTVILAPGALLYPPGNGKGLALITCYPTNALFWTSQRYVVETGFVSEAPASEPARMPTTVQRLVVPAPADLVAQGLTLQENPVLLGDLSVTGSPSAAWRQSPAPLDVEADALESYFGAEKAIANQNLRWWSGLSLAGLRLPPSWSNDARVSVGIDVAGEVVRSVTLSSTVVTMRLVVKRSELLIADVSVP